MTSTMPANLPPRTRGVVVCAAVGDALGWPQEIRSSIIGGNKARSITPEARFRAWERNSGRPYARYTERVNAGDYSDDTQLLMSVARSCLIGPEWLRHLTEVELPVWPVYQRGGGLAVISAARSWAENTPPWKRDVKTSRGFTDLRAYFNAGANGVAMRIAPHVIVTADQDPMTLLSRVIMDGIATHGHPRALVGALVHALALRHALLREGTLGYGDLIEVLAEDESWQRADWLQELLPESWQRAFRDVTSTPATAVWETTVGETRHLLDIAHLSLARGALANDDETLNELGCFDKTRNGAGTITAVAAVYLAARTASRPLSGLLRAAFLPKADTDTLASMTASLLGALHGPDWAGSLSQDVQDALHLRELADQLSAVPLRTGMSRTKTVFEEPRQWDKIRPVRAVDIRRFRRQLFPHRGDGPSRFLDGRTIERRDYEELKSNASIRADRIRLMLQDGQSLVIDTVIKITDDLAQKQSNNTAVQATSSPKRPDAHIQIPTLFDQPTELPPQLRESFKRLRKMVMAAARLVPDLKSRPSGERLDVEDLYRASWIQAVAVVESWILREIHSRRLPTTASATRWDEQASYRRPGGFDVLGREDGPVRSRGFDVWSEAANILGESPSVTAEALRSRMKLINQRRNEIVHNADRFSGDRIKRPSLTAEETIDTIDWLEMFATAAWKALSNHSERPAADHFSPRRPHG